jgi:hypothetical protein
MPSPLASSVVPNAPALVLREARRLHRAARSDHLSAALPVLRRLIKAGVLLGISLPELHRARGTVQRKHVLHLLALEAGHPSWEHYRPALRQAQPHDLLALRLHARGWATLNTWFPSEAAARAAMQGRAGRLVRVGQQAVWLAPTAQQALQGGDSA